MSIHGGLVGKFMKVRKPVREVAAGLGETRTCPMRSAYSPPCNRPGTIRVVDREMKVEYVCGGHRDEGYVQGWWSS